MLKVEVHSAKVMDYEGIKTLLQHAGVKRSRAFRTCVGGRRRVPGRGDRGKDWVEKTSGWSVHGAQEAVKAMGLWC